MSSKSSLCTSNLTSGFIDLATYDELEKYMYGGADATAYFVRETRKSTWFTQVPVVLSRASGSPEFGQEWSVTISRAGDYLLNTWLRLTVPKVTNISTCDTDANGKKTHTVLAWSPNLMHNLVKECCITFNDLVAARFDNYHLDFWSAFTTPEGKRQGYANMIGNIPELVGQPAGPGEDLPQTVLNLPLPFFYSRDSGVALPTAALPYNDMRINFSFRNWRELLQAYKLTLEPDNCFSQESIDVKVGTGGTVSDEPRLSGTGTGVQVWANYAIVSNDERKRMACAPRDILIEQVQTAPVTSYDVSQVRSQDIRFSHAIKVLFFSARNKTYNGVWSNYRSLSNIVSACKVPCKGTDGCGYTHMLIPPTKLRSGVDSVDPIDVTSLTYENTLRLGNMGSDYFMFVQPWYHAPRIPVVTGYHMYSYSLDFICLDPLGSTNYGKLTNVSITPEASEEAKAAAAEGVDGKPQCKECTPAFTGVYDTKQTFDFIVTAVNNNIIRISGGALGFPVL
jgi:hypothetical protein